MKSMAFFRYLSLIVSMAFLTTTSAIAQQKIDYEELFSHIIEGPAEIPLGNQAKLNLPANMGFLPKEQANIFIQSGGNSPDDNRYGIIFPADEDSYWWMDLTYNPSGYIKDDDAKKWDIEGMLEGLKEGLVEQNKKRLEMNLSELATDGWIEKPTYDETKHLLIWSIDVHDKIPQEDDEVAGVNYNMYALGREGYINLTLVTDVDMIDKERSIAQAMLGNITYNEGKRYSDFNPVTDKVAEYGIAALIGGGLIAKKLGLFSVIGVFIAKFAKLFLLLGAGILAFVGKLFKRKK